MENNIRIILASKSPIKIEAVMKFFNIPKENITTLETSGCMDIPNQPINSGKICCKKRISYTLEKLKENDVVIDSYKYIVAIENYISRVWSVGDDNFLTCDICQVAIYTISSEKMIIGKSKPVNFRSIYYDKAEVMSGAISGKEDYNFGMSVTVGEAIKTCHPYIDPKDWIGEREFNINFIENGYTSRLDQILDALKNVYVSDTNLQVINYTKNVLNSNIKFIKDFPKPGVTFKDLSDIISNKNLFEQLINIMEYTLSVNKVKNIDKIVGLDARGFIYGAALASKIKAGFVIARKRGKLPGKDGEELISVNYQTEYSTDSIQMMKDAITPYDRVLIADDLIATGGSLAAAEELVDKLGGQVVGYLVVLCVEPLLELAKAKLNRDIPLMITLN